MHPELHLGLRTLRGPLERYAQHYQLLEVRMTAGNFPRKTTLRKWRAAVPEPFRFSVVLPPQLVQQRLADDSHLDLVKPVMRHLKASVLVLTTDSSFTPTSKNRAHLESLAERFEGIGGAVAWEPAGMWDRQEAAHLASSLGWLLVVDPARDPLPEGPVVYGRIRGLGEGAMLSPRRLQLVIENLRARRTAYVVIETDSPGRVARDLRSSLSFIDDDDDLLAYDEQAESMVIEPDGADESLVGEDEE